ncbi:uncharacterized protein CcaverHIS019_0202960 [Cutaneotrichosporon cavernicola]|uniref:Nitrogen regulatory protein areA GATA-like domain-containing protein n=1 Tax=Cutaneotrichosporon cavernicola TaxID=279322 RepID=A0AA48I3H4_9TREE|nr:uncharacterized protein CcaverHIS019_0202960 [Cutaneotrichosporon cavernicola]BEI88934.1 hypothetical protein CcaverHIS019_0202960 [Cutaneotrichosporon cavernicola]
MTRSPIYTAAVGLGPHTNDRPAPLPTPPLTQRGSSPSPSERAGRKAAPLFTLSATVLPLSDQPPEEEDISSIWNVVSRAADVVKDSERLENLAWRHWSDVRVRRRRSSASTDTASSASVHTPVDQPYLHHRQSSENRRSFANKLQLLVEEDSFKDWIEDARENAAATDESPRHAPQLALPDTPTPNLEIRLVEPTPVPSRVGSLGGSVGGSTPFTKSVAQLAVREEEIEEEVTTAEDDSPEIQRIRKRSPKGGFFIHQSPGKVSGASDGSSEASAPPPAPIVAETEPVARVEHHQAEANGGPTDSSQWRSSAESSSAVVMKKKEPRRPVSMATMRGRFQAEKRLAVQAITARKKLEQQQAGTAPEDDDDDDSDWEDDDDETAAGSTRPTDAEDDDDDWEDEMSSVAPSAAPSPRNGKMNKKERAAATARLELEKEAMRKRAMFAKKQIDAPATKAPTEGLLSRVFRTGKSMVDLTQASSSDENAAFRRTPTHGNFGAMAQSPAPMAPPRLHSKSDVTVPVQTDANATARSHKSGTSDGKRSHRSGTSDRQIPGDVELESSEEESEDDNYLASSQIRAKLEALDAKRAARTATATTQAPPPNDAAIPVRAPVSAVAMGAAMGEYDEYGVARPISPTARRRMIIMREMSESLRRKDIILEREKSAGPPRPPGHRRPPPSVHTHMSRGSAQNLAQLREHARETGFDTSGFQRHSATFQDMRPDKALERHNSQPNLMAYAEKRSPLAGQDQVPPRQASLSPTEQKRRQNLLGHGFLRPLTRADEGGINRTQSAAALNLGVTSPTSERTVSPTASSGAHRSSSGGYHSSSGFHHPHAHLHATAMVRSSTEGDHVARERSNKREAQRRQERTDTGYRFHGW